MASGLAYVEFVDSKVCGRCGLAKGFDAFRLHYANGRAAPPVLRSYCRPCEKERQRELHLADPEKHRWRTIRHRYGIEREDYLALVAEQDGRCAICRMDEGTPRNGIGERYWLHIDHDHSTGEIRGLLCNTCNTGIGHLRHDPLLLRQALKYLEKDDDLSQ